MLVRSVAEAVPREPSRHQAAHRDRRRDVDRGVLLHFTTDQFTIRILSTGRDGTSIVEQDIRDAQRLRHDVFVHEFGAHLASARDGIDEDVYDAWCDHLVVRDRASNRVVGTYRIVRPDVAARFGYYADTEFFTHRLGPIKANLLEFGRSCIHADYRNGPVVMLLWTALARYMLDGGYEHVIGCASIGILDGGHRAASLFARLGERHAAGIEHRVFPRRPLPLDDLDSSLSVDVPPLVKGYLRVGARICGEPAWDLDFNTADLFMLLSLSRMNPRYAKHFGFSPAAGPDAVAGGPED